LSIENIPGIQIAFDVFAPILEMFGVSLDGIVLPDFSIVFHQIALWTLPFVEAIAAAIDALTFIVNVVLGNEDLSKLPQVLLNILSPLDSLNLFNIIPTDILAQINISSIGETIINMVTDPTFQDPASFTGQDIFFLDTTVAGHNGPNAAKTTANGTTRELLSNWIPVSKDQVIPISGWAKWTGLAGSGTPIQIGVTGYQPGGSSVQSIIAQRAATPPATDWTQLAGSYTVPSNVEAIRIRLIVAAGATVGDVWFDDLTANKTQSLLQRLIAGTDPGTTLNQDITNLFNGIISNAVELLNKAGLQDFNDLLSTLGGEIGNTIDDIEERLNAFLHGQSPLNADNINTGQIGDIYIPGLGTIHDTIVRAVGSISGSGFDIDKVYETLFGQKDSTVTNAAASIALHGRLSHAESRLAALPVSLGGTGVGISFGGVVGAVDTDEFERVSSTSLGPEWQQYYSSGGGVWATPNGHDAEYMWNGVSDREFICIRNRVDLPRSLTDYQRVTNVLSSKGTRHYDNILGTYNYCGHNDVLLRVSDTTTSLANMTLIRIRWGSDGSLSIVRYLNGAATTLKAYGTGYLPAPGPGAALIGEAGDINGGDLGRRYFRGIIGNSIAIEVTESGVASGMGAAFRRWGHGGRVEGWSGLFDNGQERPGTLHHWQGMDQVFS